LKTTEKSNTFAELYQAIDAGSSGSRSLFALMQELRTGLQLFWEKAGGVLAGSGIRLAAVTPDYYSLEGNFFSALFLYSYLRQGIPSARRVVYVAVNQCLRGMVTGCDNLLDNEYKMTLGTDLPASATRFRSVLDIMVSDRVLFDLLIDLCRGNHVPLDVVRKAGHASLASLARSGAEEASEEAGIETMLTPEDVLGRVHHFKTGVLFQCPWAIPALVEASLPDRAGAMKNALYRIGMGCQIFDDMVDMLSDVGTRRHNYVAALAFQRMSEAEWMELCATAREAAAAGARREATAEAVARFYGRYPQVRESAYVKALAFLKTGLRALFAQEHAFLVKPAVKFIGERIGVDLVFPGSVAEG
jgi:hypothetical protein